jgi:hypothetical protein
MQMTTDDRQRGGNSPDWRLFAAAGAAALATTSAADAAIVYVDPAVKPTAALSNPAASGAAHTSFAIDGVNVTLPVNQNSVAGTRVAGGHIGAPENFFILNLSSSFAPLEHFARGSAIAATASQVQGLAVIRRHSEGFPVIGAFASGQTGTAGFQLPTSKGGGFGWIRLEVLDRNSDGYPDEFKAIDWAYNDAGGGINAGQTTAVPEPSALGLLAMGSAGVLAWRRRRTPGSTHG